MVKTIYLAGGCFWGVQAYFSLMEGVCETVAGYANGNCENPDYEKVCTGATGFAEAVKIQYDPDEILLEEILNHFFDIIDPTSLNRQAFDAGTQYRSGVYYINSADEEIINNKINVLQKNYDKQIVTEVEKLKNFYDAEEYHQKYLVKNPSGYCHINLSKAMNFKKKD